MKINAIKESLSALCEFIWQSIGAAITMALMILGLYVFPLLYVTATTPNAKSLVLALGIFAVVVPWVSLSLMGMFQDQLKGTRLREAIFNTLHVSWLAPGIIIGGAIYLIAFACAICMMIGFAPIYGIWWLFTKVFAFLFNALDRSIEQKQTR